MGKRFFEGVIPEHISYIRLVRAKTRIGEIREVSFYKDIKFIDYNWQINCNAFDPYKVLYNSKHDLTICSGWRMSMFSLFFLRFTFASGLVDLLIQSGHLWKMRQLSDILHQTIKEYKYIFLTSGETYLTEVTFYDNLPRYIWIITLIPFWSPVHS